MTRLRLAGTIAALAVAVALVLSAGGTALAARGRPERLEMYTATVDRAQAA